MSSGKRTTVIDVNNFWSLSGGGVRRYHLQKMEYYKKQNDFHLIFLMNSAENKTEEISPSLTIEHVKAFKIPGYWWNYRFIWNKNTIKKYLDKYKPDIIEVGSPYILPAVVRKAACGAGKAALLGFWHADFPITYVKRTFGSINSLLGTAMEKLAWAYARSMFKNYKTIQVSCMEVMERMRRNGLKQLHYIPLGVDCAVFNKGKRDEQLVKELKAGNESRPTMFFPHRFCAEKGLGLLLKAYPIICEKLGVEPALVFAGTGADIRLVKEAAAKYKHVSYRGFIKSEEEMARYNASCETGFALSAYETFGLSILEGMACGQSFIGASCGAAAEHIKQSGGGIILRKRTPTELANIFCSLVQNKNQMSAMAENNCAYAQKFSWELCFKKQSELYISTL